MIIEKNRKICLGGGIKTIDDAKLRVTLIKQFLVF